MPAREIRFRDVTLRLPEHAASRCSRASTSRSRPARRSRSSARTARARPRSRSSCAGSTTRRRGAIEVDGVDLRELDLEGWRARVDRRVPGLHPLRAAAARQRGARAARPTTVIRAALAEAGAARPRRPRHGARARLPGRHRPLGRAVAARRARARALRRAARRGPGAARRADRAARRARRGGDLRPHPRGHAPRHHDPDLAPLLDGAPRRPHLRARARPRGRARHARRADGARAAATARCSSCRRRASATTARRARRSMSSTDDLPAGAALDVARARARLPGRAAGCSRVSFGLSLLAALPDALIALWLKLLADGVLGGRPRAGARRRARARRLGRGHLVPAPDQRPHAAPLPRPRDDRARVPRGASSRPRSRRSSTTSAPSTSTGSRCCATRCSCSTTCTCRCSPPAAGCCASA